MADRNPFIPAERRQDVEGKATFPEEQAHKRFAQEQAELVQEKENAPEPGHHKPEHHQEEESAPKPQEGKNGEGI